MAAGMKGWLEVDSPDGRMIEADAADLVFVDSALNGRNQD